MWHSNESATNCTQRVFRCTTVEDALGWPGSLANEVWDNSYNHKILNEKKLFTLSLPLLLQNALMGADHEDEIQDATTKSSISERMK